MVVCTEPFEPLARSLLGDETAVTLLVLPHPLLPLTAAQVAELVESHADDIDQWARSIADGVADRAQPGDDGVSTG
ncbi:MAG: hypothetical protein R8G01_06605 [Ilumatobacteraceae bacterium]|nr:hypothetical protein [Ilumatobacteraceae bacterium]